MKRRSPSVSVALALLLSPVIALPSLAQSNDASQAAYRPGLFRRNNTQTHQHQHQTQSRPATSAQNPDPISIPKPIQFDELNANPIPSRTGVVEILSTKKEDVPLRDPEPVKESGEITEVVETEEDIFSTDNYEDPFDVVVEPVEEKDGETVVDEPAVEDTFVPIEEAIEEGSVEETQPIEEQFEIPSTDQTPELSGEMVELRGKIRETLAHYYTVRESASTRSPWGIMHTLIAYGVDTEIYARGKKTNAIGWLCWNGSCRGQRLFYTRSGKIGVNQGPGVEGHKGQFLAMLAQSRVKRDYPIKINGRTFSVEDLIEHEKMTCRPRSELTFKLIGLSHYLDADATWKNDHGQDWSISRLIKEELAQPVVGAACGGTHRMMGFAYAVKRREKQGKEITGQWRRAQKYVEDFQAYTFRNQNSDGSFSTNWFAGRGNQRDRARKMQTTGHILEWMVYSLPEDQLQDERLLKAVNFLNDTMWNHRNFNWEVGPRGHAIHALVLYDQIVFGSEPGNGAPKLAQIPSAD